MLGAITDNHCSEPSGVPERFPIITIVLQLLPNNHVKDNFHQQCQMGKKTDFAFDDKVQEMTSAWRVISFFIVVFIVPTILIAVPLYARYQLYHSRTLFLSDGDVISLHDTVSSFWCQSQKISSNGSFSAFFTKEKRRNANQRRTSRMLTKIALQHDEAEEWGFYLLKGSTVQFSSCSRWPGGSLIVVQGEENMRRCFYRETRTREELMNLPQKRPASAQEPRSSSLPSQIIVVQDENHGGEVINQDDDDIQSIFPPAVQNQSALIPESRIKDLHDTSSKLMNEENWPKMDELAKKRAKRGSDLSSAFLNREKKSPLDDTSFSISQRIPTNINPKLKASLILSTYNNTQDVTFGNSSFSSSEEFMSHCISTIYSIDLSPYVDCPSRVDSKNSKSDTWQFVANESDYYFFLFSSDNSIEVNIIDFSVKLNRVLYDVSDATLECSNSTKECVFPFSFMSKGGAVVDFHGQFDQITRLENLNTYELTSFCQPRSIVYTVLILLVPFIIVLFAFR